MENSPATLKISEKVRKYHFFPRKSMFVFLKNSTLLTVPSKSVVGRSERVVLFYTANDRRPSTNDCSSNTQRFAALLAAQHPIKNRARYKHRGKQIRGQAKDQGRGETLDRPRAKQEKKRSRNDGRHVRINDR